MASITNADAVGKVTQQVVANQSHVAVEKHGVAGMGGYTQPDKLVPESEGAVN